MSRNLVSHSTLGHTYVLDVVNDMDELPALMVAIAMDAARCSDDDSRNTMW